MKRETYLLVKQILIESEKYVKHFFFFSFHFVMNAQVRVYRQHMRSIKSVFHLCALLMQQKQQKREKKTQFFFSTAAAAVANFIG